PWSPEDLRNRYGKDLSDDDPDRSKLKDQWPQARRIDLGREIADRLPNTPTNRQAGDLRGLVLPGDLSVDPNVHGLGSISLREAILIGKLHFAGKTFSGGFDLAEAEVRDGADSQRCTFAGQVDCASSEFLGSSCFRGAAFQSKAIFSKARLSDVDFREVRFFD